MGCKSRAELSKCPKITGFLSVLGGGDERRLSASARGIGSEPVAYRRRFAMSRLKLQNLEIVLSCEPRLVQFVHRSPRGSSARVCRRGAFAEWFPTARRSPEEIWL